MAATGVVGEFGRHLAEAKAADNIVGSAKTNPFTKPTGGGLVVSANPLVKDCGKGVGLTVV